MGAYSSSSRQMTMIEKRLMRSLLWMLMPVVPLAGFAGGIPNGYPELFPPIPPIAEADPAVRHALVAHVPAVMRVERLGSSLLIAFPTVQTTNVSVGYKMATGIQREESICWGGKVYPLGMSLEGGFNCEASTNTLVLSRDKLPEPGHEFTFEHRVTLFETDLPAQHMWSPQSGKLYKILWTRTFRETLR